MSEASKRVHKIKFVDYGQAPGPKREAQRDCVVVQPGDVVEERPGKGVFMQRGIHSVTYPWSRIRELVYEPDAPNPTSGNVLEVAQSIVEEAQAIVAKAKPAPRKRGRK